MILSSSASFSFWRRFSCSSSSLAYLNCNRYFSLNSANSFCLCFSFSSSAWIYRFMSSPSSISCFMPLMWLSLKSLSCYLITLAFYCLVLYSFSNFCLVFSSNSAICFFSCSSHYFSISSLIYCFLRLSSFCISRSWFTSQINILE